MNKLLIGTAAAALFTVPAAAGPISVTLGGYMNSMYYSTDVEGHSTNYGDDYFLEDGEIIIKGEGSSDGGLTYGFQVQIENSAKGDATDEHYAYVKGDFGKVIIGGENAVADLMTVSAPKFLGWKTYDNKFETWKSTVGYKRPLVGNEDLSKDSAKLSYYTPKINGLQFGVSWTPNTKDSSGPSMTLEPVANSDFEDIMSYAVRYSGNMGGSKVKLSYSYEEGDSNDRSQDAEGSSFGASVSNGPWEIGGTFYEAEDKFGDYDVEIGHYGIQYKLTSNTKIGVAIHDQENSTYAGVKGSDTEITVIGGSYKVGPGAQLTISYEDAEQDLVSGTDKEADFLGVGLLLKF